MPTGLEKDSHQEEYKWKFLANCGASKVPGSAFFSHLNPAGFAFHYSFFFVKAKTFLPKSVLGYSVDKESDSSICRFWISFMKEVWLFRQENFTNREKDKSISKITFVMQNVSREVNIAEIDNRSNTIVEELIHIFKFLEMPEFCMTFAVWSANETMARLHREPSPDPNWPGAITREYHAHVKKTWSYVKEKMDIHSFLCHWERRIEEKIWDSLRQK